MSEQQPANQPYSALDIARMYAIHGESDGSSSIHDWLGTPFGNDPADPHTLKQAAADTVRYMERRPAAPDGVPHIDAHYYATMGPTNQDVCLGKLLDEWISIDATDSTHDRTRQYDLEEEVVRRTMRRSATDPQATGREAFPTPQSAELAAYALGALYNRRARLQRSMLAGPPRLGPASGAQVASRQREYPEDQPIPLPAEPSESSLESAESLPSEPEPLSPSAEFVPPEPAADEVAASVAVPPSMVSEKEQAWPVSHRLPTSSRWQRTKNTFINYFYDPEHGARRRTLAAVGALALSYAGGAVSMYLAMRHGLFVGHYSQPKPPSVHTIEPPQVDQPPQAASSHTVWAAEQATHPSLTDAQINQSLHQHYAALRAHGWQAGQWINPHNPNIWGFSNTFTAPHDQYLLFPDGHIEYLDGQTYSGTAGTFGALQYAEAYQHAHVISAAEAHQLSAGANSASDALEVSGAPMIATGSLMGALSLAAFQVRLQSEAQASTSRAKKAEDSEEDES